MDKRLLAFQRLLDIMDELREQCPWDRKQTFESLRTLTIEEAYELTDSIIDQNPNEMAGELGDLFLHLIFYCKIGSEQNLFNVESVLNQICDKLISRHPHIYGDTKVNSDEEVKTNWEKIKLAEGKKSVLEGVPKSLPALIKAYRIQDKVKGVGFDWDQQEDVWNKINEELGELKEAIEQKNQGEIEMEFGDVLFSLINVSRFIHVNPENALERTNLKFMKRFQLMEELISEDQKNIAEMNLQEMDIYWEKAKKILN